MPLWAHKISVQSQQLFKQENNNANIPKLACLRSTEHNLTSNSQKLFYCQMLEELLEQYLQHVLSST